MSKCDCCLTTTIIATVIFGGILTYYSFKLAETENLVQTECTVDRVIYPKEHPKGENQNTWGRCSCGKRCTFSTSIITIYATVPGKNNDMILQEDNLKTDTGHTFYDTRCLDFNKPGYYDRKINEAEKIYKEYMNSTIGCFFNEEDGEIYLEKENTSLATIIVFGILFLITLLSCCCQLRKDEEKK